MDKEKIKKQAEGWWGEVKKMAEKTKEGLGKVTKISQLKIDQTRQKHDRNNLLRELGEVVFELSKQGKREFDSSVTDIIDQIDNVDKKITEETDEIKCIRGGSKENPGEASKKEGKAKSGL